MLEQSIQSTDMALANVFQDFYCVPDYQREYVWGEDDPKGQRGDEVEQFIGDIWAEYQSSNGHSSPEYFIGTVVVCRGQEAVFDLIDGQQRITTAFLMLCAIRDELKENGETSLEYLLPQISAVTADSQGKIIHRVRLELQYEDSQGVLDHYAKGAWEAAPRDGTRSISNIAGAYATIREFLKTNCKGDPELIRRFYGYFINKVKLIRIETSSLAKALKIFETVNDRGVGLDAMDLLKNLLFMHADSEDFAKLKSVWKQATDAIFHSREKPLRFLRYFIFADFNVSESKLQEDAIYNWFLKNEPQTGHSTNPIKFAERLLGAAKTYAGFVEGHGPSGQHEEGITNTRCLGGSAVRQHYIMLLAGRHLNSTNFSSLAIELENLMFAYLVTNTLTKEYESSIIEWSKKLRSLNDDQFEGFRNDFFVGAKKGIAEKFGQEFGKLTLWNTRAFRIRYALAKLTQVIDVRAYGDTGGHGILANYVNGKNDIEHILPANPSEAALAEFGEVPVESDFCQRLGNLMLVEKTINQIIVNKPYSEKAEVYPQSQYLLVKCQASTPVFGVADHISKVVTTVPSFGKWDKNAIDDRRDYMVELAREVWEVPL
jgi:hypothetical protein